MPSTTAIEMTAIQSVTPVPNNRAWTTASTGTDAIEIAAEYASRSPSPPAGRRKPAQK